MKTQNPKIVSVDYCIDLKTKTHSLEFCLDNGTSKSWDVPTNHQSMFMDIHMYMDYNIVNDKHPLYVLENDTIEIDESLYSIDTINEMVIDYSKN